MSTNNKSFDRSAYTEKVLNMTSARFLDEAAAYRFEKRRTPVSTWIAAACFALIFAAAAILLIKPLRERPVVIPANSSEPTASPTEQAGETPTPAPDTTALPTKPIPDPIPADWDCDPYCMETWDALYAYFKLTDASGVSNGEKCFKNYDPTMTAFWGTECGSDTGSWLTWEAIGTDMPDELYLTDIYLAGTEDEPLYLVGTFGDFYCSAKALMCENVIFDSIDLRHRADFGHPDTIEHLHAVNDAVYIGDRIWLGFDISSDTRCYYESTGKSYHNVNGEETVISSLPYAFTVELTAEGSGSVGVTGKNDEHYYVVEVYANPKEGQKFLGWYDADGKLISAEQMLEISYNDGDGSEAMGYTGVRDFTGTARFAPSDEPPLAEYHARLTFVNGLGEELNDLNFFIDGDNSDVTAYGLSETVTKFDINEYSLDKLSIVACVSEKHQDGAYITHKHVLPYFKYKHGDVIELKKNGETAFATVTRSGGSYELPVISYEYVSGHLLSMSEELLHPVVSYIYGERAEINTGAYWKYISTEYSIAKLNEQEAAKYPELARALEARNARIEAEMNAAYEEMLANADEHNDQRQLRPISAVRRADSIVLAFVNEELIERHDLENNVSGRRLFSSENYETATGRLLNLSDVVTDASALASILNAELEKGDAAFRFDPAKHFNAPSADFAWTLDHDGLFFIINENDSSVCVPFIEHEGLVKSEFMPVSENYMMEFTDPDEALIIVRGKVESLSMYSDHIRFTGWDEWTGEYAAAFIHADGRDYILINGWRDEWSYSENLLLFGNGFACSMSNAFTGASTVCNTDPGRFIAQTNVMAIGYHWGLSTGYALNDDGRFVRTDDYFEADFERTLLKEYTVEEIDLDGNTIGTITIGAGETVRVFRFNYGFEDARTADGRIVRLTLPENSDGYTNYEESMAIFGNLDFGP